MRIAAVSRSRAHQPVISTSGKSSIMMLTMRTTITFEPDVAARVKQEQRRTGKGLKALVNEALRLGLGLSGNPAPAPRFEVRPHAFGFKPGIDLDRMNQLVDELESEEAARRLER
jgi:hypothetical protein